MNVAPAREPSAIDALGEAVDHTRAKLFPLGFLGWITLGFVTLIESCPSGGGTERVRNRIAEPDRSSFEDPVALIQWALSWAADNLGLVVAAVLIFMVLSVLVVWVRSRAIFVYIDDVATGRADIVRPWNQHSAHADSFFFLSLVVQGIAFISFVLILGLCVLGIVWVANHENAAAIGVIAAVPMLLFICAAILFSIAIDMALRDFVAPLQLIRGISARQAAETFLEMFWSRPWLWIGYAFVKFIVWIIVRFAIFFLSCLTCCVGALPLINETIFQPIYFTERAWSLKFLSHLGEDVFNTLNPPPPPPVSTYHAPDEAPTGPIDLSAIDFEKPPEY